MTEKTTEELQKVLCSTHPEDLSETLQEQQELFLSDDLEFDQFIKDKLKEKGITKREVLINADIPERYGYKLLSSQKRTRQRDVVYRICYAARLDFEETQKAFHLYRLPELYPKNHRDAILIVALNTQKRDIFEVNKMLTENGESPLYMITQNSGAEE